MKDLRAVLFEDEKEEGGEVISLNIPLFIRLMEFAREEAKNDLILHKIAERASEFSEDCDYLEMKHYNQLVRR